MRPATASPAETPASLEAAANTFRDALRADPDGPYAEHYRKALAYVERRLKAWRR